MVRNYNTDKSQDDLTALSFFFLRKLCKLSVTTECSLHYLKLLTTVRFMGGSKGMGHIR